MSFKHLFYCYPCYRLLTHFLVVCLFFFNFSVRFASSSSLSASLHNFQFRSTVRAEKSVPWPAPTCRGLLCREKFPPSSVRRWAVSRWKKSAKLELLNSQFEQKQAKNEMTANLRNKQTMDSDKWFLKKCTTIQSSVQLSFIFTWI